MSAEPLVTFTGGVPALPLALAVATICVAGGRTRERRLRRRLNAALHELRRPLQALALAHASPARGPDPVALAVAAVRDMDRVVNGGPPEFRRRPVIARDLAIAAAERWRIRVARSGRRIGVRWRCGDELADVDPLRVSQALDNLIANALEHGGGEITIEGVRHDGTIDLVVRDRGAATRPRGRTLDDPRRGHGLGIARALASRSGGALRPLTRTRGETLTALVLPLAEGRVPPRRGSLRR